MQPQYITLPNKRCKDITNQRFGRLVALGPIAKDRRNQIVWLCKCDCGKITRAIYSQLKPGLIKSCGCWKNDATAARNTTHGLSHEPLYKIWAGVIKRCVNPNSSIFKHYGGRGITVCGEWRTSYQAFRDHVINLPNFGTKGYSLDRIQNNGNYEPGNVRWATEKEQKRNTRQNRIISFNGTTKTLAAWAEDLHISSAALAERLLNHSLEIALTTPVGELKSIPRKSDT